MESGTKAGTSTESSPTHLQQWGTKQSADIAVRIWSCSYRLPSLGDFNTGMLTIQICLLAVLMKRKKRVLLHQLVLLRKEKNMLPCKQAVFKALVHNSSGSVSGSVFFSPGKNTLQIPGNQKILNKDTTLQK